jgi:hypothetical protein
MLRSENSRGKGKRPIKWPRYFVRRGPTRTTGPVIDAPFDEQDATASCTTPVAAPPYLSQLPRFLSLSSFPTVQNGKRHCDNTYSPSISSPLIPQESAHAYSFGFTLISLEQARADANIVFRKEAFEEREMYSQARTSGSDHDRAYLKQSTSGSSYSHVSLANTSISDESTARLLSHHAQVSRNDQENSTDDISIYSTPRTEELLRTVCNAPHIGMLIRTGAFDISSELSTNMGSVNGDTEYSIAHLVSDEFAPARATFAARAAVRQALEAEALDM